MSDLSAEELAKRQAGLRHFTYKHLPAHLQAVSKPFCELASRMVDTLPPCAERSAGLRKLLEAKDCAVRAHLERDETNG